MNLGSKNSDLRIGESEPQIIGRQLIEFRFGILVGVLHRESEAEGKAITYLHRGVGAKREAFVGVTEETSCRRHRKDLPPWSSLPQG